MFLHEHTHTQAKGMRAHMLHFPDDLAPFHCDATFVPIRPYLCVENPVRPMEKEERALFLENDWKLITAAYPNVRSFFQCVYVCVYCMYVV